MITICYFAVVDNDKLICYGTDDELLLPHIKIEKDFTNQQETKKYISKTTFFTIEKNSFVLIFADNKTKTYVYSCAIDVNVKKNKEVVQANFKNPKCIPFGTLFARKWESGSKRALSALENSSKYKEVISFLKTNDEIHYYSETSHSFLKEHFVEMKNIWQSESPDIFIETSKDLIGLEVFSFDASLDNGHGSSGLVVEKEVLKRFDDYSKEFQTYSFHVNNSKESYIKNFKGVFDNHINKLQTYLNNLKLANKDNKNTMFGFLINDMTQLGTSYLDKESGFSAFFPYQFKEFWDFLFKEKSLDFLIFSQYVNNSRESVLITRDDYEELKSRNKIFSINQVNLLFMNNPIVMGQNFFIDLDEIKKKNK